MLCYLEGCIILTLILLWNCLRAPDQRIRQYTCYRNCLMGIQFCSTPTETSLCHSFNTEDTFAHLCNIQIYFRYLCNFDAQVYNYFETSKYYA